MKKFLGLLGLIFTILIFCLFSSYFISVEQSEPFWEVYFLTLTVITVIIGVASLMLLFASFLK